MARVFCSTRSSIAMRLSRLSCCVLALLGMPFVPATSMARDLLTSPAGVTTQPPADGSPREPDRRPGRTQAAQPSLQAGGLTLNEHGASYRSESSRERLQLRLGAGTGKGSGASLGIDYARILSDQWALGVNVSGGAGRAQDLMLNGLYSPAPDLHVGLSMGWLRSTDSYRFYSGSDDVTVNQQSALLRVKKQFDKDSVLTHVSASAYLARAKKPDVPDLVMTEETSTLIRFLVDPREISPGRLQGFALGMGLAPWGNADIKLGLGSERLTYRFMDGSMTDQRRLTASVDYRHTLPGCWQVEGGMATGVASNRLNMGVRKGIWMLAASHDASRQGQSNQTRVVVGMEIPLGNASEACRSTSSRSVAALRRLDEVFTRPSELPTRALAQVDLTAKPYLLASLDKTGLAGATVTATPDALILTLSDPATAVADLFINGVQVSNMGSDGQPLLWVQGTSLYIGIRRLPNIGAGQTVPVEAVVLLAGGGLALVSFNVTGN